MPTMPAPMPTCSATMMTSTAMPTYGGYSSYGGGYPSYGTSYGTSYAAPDDDGCCGHAAAGLETARASRPRQRWLLMEPRSRERTLHSGGCSPAEFFIFYVAVLV